MLRSLRWRWAKLRLASELIWWPSLRVRYSIDRHTARPADLPPNTPAYGLLAAQWNRYAGQTVRRYGRFLVAAGRHCRTPIRSVLDLACGTGLIARDVARFVPSVVGIDLSEAMLRRAEMASNRSGVRYALGDFRHFALGETFDAIVCGGDSINYVTSVDELTATFRCVYEHLVPGGLFVFDALDDWYLRRLDGRVVYAKVDGVAFQIYFMYDAKNRICDDRAVLGTAVEQHRRMAVEGDDVRCSAAAAGLAIVDSAGGGLLTPRRYYVLRRPT